MDQNTLSTFLFKEFDKHERLTALSKMYHLFESKNYWQTLGEVWVNNESIFKDIDIVETLWHGCDHHPIEDRHYTMSFDNKNELNSFPGEFTVYRGASSVNLLGWSWTIDKEKAIWFANRFAVDGKPFLVQYNVRKVDVLAYFDQRNEKEIVIYPPELDDVTVTRLPDNEPSQSALLYLLVQSGHLFEGEQLAKARAIASSMTWEMIEDYFNQRIAELEELGLDWRVDEVEELFKIYKSAYEGQI